MSLVFQPSANIARLKESATLAVAAKARALKAAGQPIIDLGAGEPDFDTPAFIREAAEAAVEAGATRYTATEGILPLREAIAADANRLLAHGAQITAAEIVVSNGSKQSLYNACVCCFGPGDEVLIPTPAWTSYFEMVELARAVSVPVFGDEANDLKVTADQLAAAATPRTKGLMLNSPSNPSGAVLPQAEFERIFAVTSARGIWLMTDECYCRFLYDSKPFSIASVPGAKDTVIVAGSLSKTYAMTGWRIGFALGPKPVIDAIMKLQSHSTSNPTSICQKAAVEALRGPQESIDVMLAAYKERRRFVIDRLRQIPGVSLDEPQGAFYAYPDISVAFGKNGINSSMDFCERLLSEAHVAVVPGEAFGTSKHIRISYATSMHEIERGLDRIHNFIVSLG